MKVAGRGVDHRGYLRIYARSRLSLVRMVETRQRQNNLTLVAILRDGDARLLEIYIGAVG